MMLKEVHRLICAALPLKTIRLWSNGRKEGSANSVLVKMGETSEDKGRHMSDPWNPKRYFMEIIRIFVALSILPVFWPVAIITVLVLLSVRYIVQKALDLFYGPNVYKLMSSDTSDGIFGHKADGNSAIIHSFTVLKGDPDIEKIRERYRTHVFAYNDPLTKRKNIYEKVKWSLTTKFGFHCWHNVSSKFDIKYHARYLDSIRPNEVYTEDKLMSLMSRLMSQDLTDESRPQWEHLIIPNYRLNHENPDTRPNHFVSVYRVHHAFADGASFGILTDSVLADKPLSYAVDPMKPFAGMTPLKKAWIHFKALTVGPLDFLLTLKSSIMDDSPIILRKYSHQKFVDWSRPMNLSLFKEIKNVSGASLPSIIISAMTGSLKKLHERVEMEYNGKVCVPETISVGNMVVMLPYPNREMQNHFTTFSVPYPLKEENIIKRLKMCDEVGRNYLGSSEPWFHFYIMRFSSICPKIVQDILLELPAAPIVFSNIPGITESYQLFDRELIDVGAWLPLFKAYGMAISTYSYCNKLRICVTSDSKLFENQAQLKSFIRSIEEGFFDLAKYYGVETTKGSILSSSSLKNQNHFSDKLNLRRLSASRWKANG